MTAADVEQRLVSTPSGIARRRWHLLVESGPDRGDSVGLDASTVLIGAAPASVIALRDDTVSRYHAELDVMTAGLRIRDLKSTNGTYLADRDGPVAEGFLWPQSQFRLGETWLRIEAHDEAVAPSEPPASALQLGGLVGRTPVMQEVFRSAHMLAASAGPVMLVGKVGTGRAAIARQIHRLSPRADQPLFTVDASPDVSEQLFGDDDRSTLRRAAGGTVLLRNVDQFPRLVQVNLREAIERGNVRAGDARRLNVRFLATCASKRDVEPSLRRHLAVAQIEVPSLEDRRLELVPLAEHFLHGAGWKQLRLGPRARAQLNAVEWPDQVAGLSRLVQRLPLSPDTVDDALPALPAIREAFLTDLLRGHAGDVSAAAAELSVETAKLFRTLHVYDIDIDG